MSESDYDVGEEDAGMALPAGRYADNKHPGVFAGPTQTVKNVDAAALSGTPMRKDPPAETRFALGQSTGYITPA